MPSATTPSQDKLGFQGEGFDWNEYIKYRPAYPPSFYNRLYTEHAQNLNTFGVINDVGAGAGIASEKLAEKFKKVIVSEPNAKYVKIAEQRLNSLNKFPKDKFSFLPEGGEKSSLQDSSLDALTICEAIHWTDMPTSINEFGRCLKSGGTLGIFQYAAPYFEDEGINELWRNLIASAASRYQDNEVYTRAFHNMLNGYQNIYFDPKIWKEGVKRLYVNTGGNLDMMRMKLPKHGEGEDHLRELYKAQPQNRVGETDKLEWIEADRDEGKEWCDEKDFDFMKNMYLNMILGKKEESYREPMEKLKRAMGDGKHKMRYPAFQIIATRR